MRKTLLLSSFLSALFFSGIAQINDQSPFPVDFVINSPVSAEGEYPYGSMATNAGADLWGPTLSQTVTGDVVWAYSAPGDSLCCEPITTDLTGKMAFIRRGVCNFSLKVWHAQEQGAIGVIIGNHFDDVTQDGNSLVGMLGGDSMALVTIPAVFVSRNTATVMETELANGNTLNASFAVRSFANAFGPLANLTPQNQILPMELISADFTNLDIDNATDVEVTVDITDPGGGTTTLTSMGTVDPIATQTFGFDPYTPADIGAYDMSFTNSINDEVLERRFWVTDKTFGLDNDEVTGFAAPTMDFFIDNNNPNPLRYDMGSTYFSGVDGGVGTHVTFALNNAAELYTGVPVADQFLIIIYDLDPENDGVIETTGVIDYTPYQIAGVGLYVLDGTEEPGEFITVELEETVTLKPEGAYLTTIQYNGIEAGLGIPPQYSIGGSNNYTNLNSTVFLDQLYLGGWAGGANAIIRLHLDGFVNTQDLEPLDASKISLFPNPTSDQVNLNLDLDQIAERVEIGLLDFTGKLLRTRSLDNVQRETINFDVSNLANGTYFLSVMTPEGHRSKKFVVQK